MSSVEAGQTYDPLREFGKGDLRGLEEATPETTTANVFRHLKNEYQEMGLNLTPDQMVTHVVSTVGLTEEEILKIFPKDSDQSPEERDKQTLRVFLSVSYLDSMLIPGALKDISRKPAAKWNGKTTIEMLTRENLDEFTYSRYKLLGAEMTSA